MRPLYLGFFDELAKLATVEPVAPVETPAAPAAPTPPVAPATPTTRAPRAARPPLRLGRALGYGALTVGGIMAARQLMRSRAPEEER